MAEKRKRVYDPAKRRAAYLRARSRAQAEGFSSPSAKQRFVSRQRATGVTFTEYQKARSLTKLGVTEKQFEAMRRANIMHEPEGARRDGKPGSFEAKLFQSYKTELDAEETNWSEARVGYIVSYYWAVTQTDTNYFSMSAIDRIDEIGPPPTKRYKDWAHRQFMYLVRYGGFEMGAAEFDDRYGDGGPISQRILKGTL